MHYKIAWIGAGIVLGMSGCQTMDVASLKSGVGLTSKPDAYVPDSTKTGPTPIKKPYDNSAIQPPPSVAPPAADVGALKSLLDSNTLPKEYNAVLVTFLANESIRWMTAAQRKAVLDQAVTALKELVRITGAEQVETGLGTAVSMLMQLSGSDVIGEAGASVAGDYYSQVNEWIDAAFDLAALGYLKEASDFFEHGMKHFAYDDQRGRCVAGYAATHPDKAYDFLVEKLKGPSTEEIQTAIRMLGHLAGADNLDAARKDKVMETLISYAQGMMNAVYFPDAIYALDVSNDPRAVPALKKFMKGMMVTDEQQRPALTSLALHYKDAEAIAVLRSIVNAGMMATYDWQDKQFAFTTLVRAGDDAGYAYAEKNLIQRAKGFFADTNQPDLKPDIIATLVRYGDGRGAKAMAASFAKYDDDEWIKTWMSAAMLLLGDASMIDFAKAHINQAGWEFTSVDIAQGLARFGDYSGVQTLARLLALREVPPSPGMQIMRALAGNDDTKAKRERLESLRMKIAFALGQIDHPSCIPVLETALKDECDAVRRSAGNALMHMTIPEALPCMTLALDVRYGIIPDTKTDTTPDVHAGLVRAGGNRWGGDPRVKPLLDKASQNPMASVKALGLAMSR